MCAGISKRSEDVIRRGHRAEKTRQDREADVVQTIDLDFPMALDRLRYLALTMSSLFVVL